ncbi:22985_t:CDS:2, partial [Gigaspora margarita]
QKKHDTNNKENSLEWATPLTRPKKSIPKTKNNTPAIKRHGTTDPTTRLQKMQKLKMLVLKKQQKKHDINDEENSLEWVTPTTIPKKIVNETAPAIKKHNSTNSNNKTTEKAKTKN